MKTARLVAIPALLLPCLVAGTAPGQQPSQEPDLGCDPSAIRWFVPGEFKAAQERARAEKRLLIIKGISFGVDDAGAKCATKGKW